MLSRVLWRGTIQGAPDHICDWGVRLLSRMQGYCSGCSGLCLPLGGVRVLSRVLSRVLRIIFAIGRCQGAVRPGCCPGCSGSCLPLGRLRVVSRGAIEGCCPRCSGLCLPWCCPAVLSRVLRITFAIGQCAVEGAVQGAVQGVVQGAVHGAPDHVCDWAVSGGCPGYYTRDKGSKAEPEFNILISIWGLCWCIFFLNFIINNIIFLKYLIYILFNY